MGPLEQQLRAFVHKTLCQKDANYQRMEYMRMNPQSGEIHVRWIDREGRTRDDNMKFTR
jgi:hypothetical protein